MIKTIIIEDEINARSALHKMISFLCPDIDILAEADNISQGLEAIKKHRPDLVFLDIRLNDHSAFELLEKLDTINFKIIFTTAYDQYAIKAFKFNAIDYLLKPIDPDELKTAIKKSAEEIRFKNEYRDLLEMIKNQNTQKKKKIVLKTTEQRFVIPVKDILYLKAEGSYTLFIISTQANILISKNIKYYQDILNDSFIRTHHSYLVNKDHIKGLNNNEIILANGETIPVSGRKKADVLKFIIKG